MHCTHMYMHMHDTVLTCTCMTLYIIHVHCMQGGSMFEAVCSERIQQFDDDPESEEEEEEDDDSNTWADKDANLSSPMDHLNR